MAAPSATAGIAVLGAGPAGLTAAHLLGSRGTRGRRLRGRLAGRRHREDGRARRLPLRPRRPPVLHEGAVGAGDVGGDARRRVPAPPAALAHLLPRRLLRLSAPRRGRRPPPRRRRDDPLPRLLHGGAGCAAQSHRRRSRSGSRAASAAASTTPSSASTPRRCGGFPAARSRPSGRPSGSATSRSGPR